MLFAVANPPIGAAESSCRSPDFDANYRGSFSCARSDAIANEVENRLAALASKEVPVARPNRQASLNRLLHSHQADSSLESMRKLPPAVPIPRIPHAMRQALWLAVVLLSPGFAQNIPNQSRLPSQQPIHHPEDDAMDGPDGDPADREQRLQALNRERQKSIVSDTNKLLKFAGELDLEVKSGDSDTLTPAQMRKLAAIEKLARSVKDKMSFSIKDPSAFRPPPPFPNP
jgi:hypothetical protein